jgi:nicotinic acid mononucleotide adenylyltransferase
MFNKWMSNKKFYFPIGRDVINRIYQTDSALSNSTDEVKSYINSIVNDYKDNFKFILFERDGVEKIKETNLYNDLIIYKEYNKFSDISSTKIRGGLKTNLV